MAEPFKISIVICTSDNSELLKGALETLDDQYFQRKDYQIVVVDHGTRQTAETERVVRSFGISDRLEYFCLRGKTEVEARSKAIKESDADWLLFLNDDILAPPDLLDLHFEAHRANPHIVARGPLVNTLAYKIPTTPSGGWTDWSMSYFDLNNASISKFALIQVGGPDVSLVEYAFPAHELGWRLLERGWLVKVIKKAAVYRQMQLPQYQQRAAMIQKAKDLAHASVEYYGKNPSWRLGLETGMHPWLKPWQRMTGSEWLFDKCMERWDDVADDLKPGMRSFLEFRLYGYYYLKALEEEQSGGFGSRREPDAAKREPEAARPRTPDKENLRLGHQGLGADVHLQSQGAARPRPRGAF